ncbi:hypothetical protein FNF27_05150 [Cafeteria roenbergensis]|uniref:Uncharacterized protein n=2 Tax=Cafeteria roenbergensis TaxID=33653 RepID=A0A5A8E6H3_CAFRO|nr:hypothetical protein FNF29_06042 [Cafeteria roenbergensis]KAA0150400.1 hypothetical protein FNF28_07261 [Cafeteria roenbergensis]KAA0157913.1 hypothetical protein FNF31_05641 [Cafeteria roenbergensis]KAA0173373.1 hypothetical protein FNF27_05150 [Cafeteria roenbergensis]|eukprot:KAA0149337.1 hypothetical protein FNF29_06042 [Cafeteria roenbergensis]
MASSSSAAMGFTGGSAFASTGAGSQPGLKRKVEALEAELRSQGESVAALKEAAASKDEKDTDVMASFRDELNAAIREVRAEFSDKLESLTAQVAQLQRQVNVAKGEANILAQQNKDTSRRLAEVGEQVQRLAVEVVGDDALEAGGDM